MIGYYVPKKYLDTLHTSPSRGFPNVSVPTLGKVDANPPSRQTKFVMGVVYYNAVHPYRPWNSPRVQPPIHGRRKKTRFLL